MTRAAAASFVPVLLLAAAQLVPSGRSPNPPVRRASSFEKHVQAPPEVHGLLRRACMDCHSHETRWPWYSHVAPVSWMIAADVERGRSVMNLSEWSSRPEVGASLLYAACEAARSGRMPPAPYRLLHPEARLSETDVQMLCSWTDKEFTRLMDVKRQSRVMRAER